MDRAEYGRLLTEAYDLDKPVPPADELTFYAAHIAQCGEPVLEVMSGSGRFLVPLLAAGFDVDGVDASADVLAACARKCAERDLEPRLHKQLIHELDLPPRYAFAFCGGGSFGLVSDEAEVAESLIRIRARLQPGGWLLLEVETPAARHPGPDGAWFGNWWRRADGATIVLRGTHRYDELAAVEHGIGVYELFVDGRLVSAELDNWVRRFWDAEGIAAALGAAGFAEITVSRAFSAEAPSADDTMLSVLARNPPVRSRADH